MRWGGGPAAVPSSNLGGDVERVDADNSWIWAANRAPRRALGWVVALAGGLWAGAVVGWAPGLARPLLSSIGASGGPWTDLLATAASYAVVFGPLFLAAMAGGAAEGRPIWRLGGRPAAAAAAGLALGAGGFALSLGIAFAAGAVTRGSGAATDGALIGPAAIDVLLVLLGAAAEELYFRGWMQPVLGGRWGAWVGLLATSLIFCGLHIVGGARAPLAAINIFLAGLFFGLLALRSGGLAAPIAAHFAWNWSETGLFGSDPNPGAGPFGALVDVDLNGPALWSGGADTMNGSLATTLVLSTLIAGLMLAVGRGRSGPARSPR